MQQLFVQVTTTWDFILASMVPMGPLYTRFTKRATSWDGTTGRQYKAYHPVSDATPICTGGFIKVELSANAVLCRVQSYGWSAT